MNSNSRGGMSYAPPASALDQLGATAATPTNVQHHSTADSPKLPEALLDGSSVTSTTNHGRFQTTSPLNASNTVDCLITTFDLSDGRQVIVMSELADNPGSSISNSADFLVPAVFKTFGSGKIADTVFIEHYSSKLSYRDEPSEWETFSRVIVEEDHNGQPAPQGWEPVSGHNPNDD